MTTRGVDIKAEDLAQEIAAFFGRNAVVLNSQQHNIVHIHTVKCLGFRAIITLNHFMGASKWK